MRRILLLALFLACLSGAADGVATSAGETNRADADAWRYVQHNGALWYWQTNRMWRRWEGDHWSAEIAPSPSPPVRRLVVPYGTANGFNPDPMPGYWIGPQRPGAGWVGGFYSSGGGRTDP